MAPRTIKPPAVRSGGRFTAAAARKAVRAVKKATAAKKAVVKTSKPK